MALKQARGMRVKTVAAAAGGLAVVAMGLVGVMASGAPDASASSGTPAMDVGTTTTMTTPAKDMPAKAVPVVKAARYGAS